MYKYLLLILFCCFACTSQKSVVTEKCIDPAKINPQAPCFKNYKPVCGCDGKTYGNECEAENAGLLEWVSGKCPENK